MESNSIFTTTGTATTGFSGTTITTNPSYLAGTSITTSGTTLYGSLTLNNNTNSMNQQVKVAVFQVTRNKYNEIKASRFIQEMWIEKKPGVSVDFAVARELGDEFEADEIIIKEIYTVTL
jgi:hypothetical protein